MFSVNESVGKVRFWSRVGFPVRTRTTKRRSGQTMKAAEPHCCAFCSRRALLLWIKRAWKAAEDGGRKRGIKMTENGWNAKIKVFRCWAKMQALFHVDFFNRRVQRVFCLDTSSCSRLPETHSAPLLCFHSEYQLILILFLSARTYS